MNPEMAIKAAIDLVPNWYFAPAGANSYDVTIGDTTVTFYSLRRLTPQLVDLLSWIRTDLDELIPGIERFPDAVGVDLIQEYFAERWLRRAAPDVQWKKLFDYSRALSHRTYENAEIEFNVIIRNGTTGTVDITENVVQKIIAPLSSTRWTYFEVDPHLRLTGYNQVIWAEIDDTTDYNWTVPNST